MPIELKSVKIWVSNGSRSWQKLDLAGDSTTTATVLAHAVYREGLKNVTAGANPVYLSGIDKAVEAGVAKLLRDSKKVSDREEVRQVATVRKLGW